MASTGNLTEFTYHPAPLDRSAPDELIEAVKDGELFKLWYTSVPAPETHGHRDRSADGQQASGSMLPFAIIDNATGEAVGMTNYLNVDR